MKVYSKQFETKYAMGKYFNKVRKNPVIDICWAGFFTETGYTVFWKYKRK